MYLLSVKFKIITDHKSLTFLLTTPFHTARLMRCALGLQEYQFEIKHCRGSDNLVADFLAAIFSSVCWNHRVKITTSAV